MPGYTPVMLLSLLALPLLSLDCYQLQRGVTFQVGPGVSARLQQLADDPQAEYQPFRLQVGRQTLTASGDCNPQFEMNALVADFNFDGWRDVAVPTDTGYGGVNTFYDVYFYRPKSRTFQKTRYSDKLSEFATRANLSPDPQTQIVDGAYKSGPAYVNATLCPTPDGLDLYLCRRGELSQNLDQIGAADDYDWTWYDPRGRVLAFRPLRRSGEDRSLWTVTPTRLPLRPGPVVGRPATSYVVHGDKVEVLELRSEWAHVTYTGKGDRVFNGWVPRSAIK